MTTKNSRVLLCNTGAVRPALPSVGRAVRPGLALRILDRDGFHREMNGVTGQAVKFNNVGETRLALAIHDKLDLRLGMLIEEADRKLRKPAADIFITAIMKARSVAHEVIKDVALV